MVYLSIDTKKQPRGKGYFKMNNSLLENENYSEKICSAGIRRSVYPAESA